MASDQQTGGAPQGRRAIARARRREALARGWGQFRTRRAGMAGLGILLFFTLSALLAPVLFPPETISVTRATGELLAPPSGEFWLGTDDSGRSMLALLAWGARVSLTVGIAATLISMVIGTSVGIASGHYHGFGGAALQRL
nr:ABC transporter permease [Actinomycetota bacterium]